MTEKGAVREGGGEPGPSGGGCKRSLNKRGFREKVLKRGPLFADGAGKETQGQEKGKRDSRQRDHQAW